MRARKSTTLLLVAASLSITACGKLLAPPPRPRTEGYSALVTVRAGGAELAKFHLAVRGEAIRRSTTDAEDSPWFVRKTAKGVVYEVNPATKSYRVGTPEALLAHLEDFPLGADFNHSVEAHRRGIGEYRRESDAVFAGNACNIWSFSDRPDAFNSPSTTYWVAPALDGIVVRKERLIPMADGKDEKTFVELTFVRSGVNPSDFEIPEGFRLEGSPEK